MIRRNLVQLPVLGFACAFALLSFVGVIAYLDARRLADTTVQLDETHAVIERLDAVAIGVERIVTAVRVFLLTGTEDVIAAIPEAQRGMTEDFSALRELLADTDQLANIDALEQLVERRVDLSEQYVALRRRLGLQETTDEIQAGGESLASEIRDSISDIERTVRLRLDQRRSVVSEAHAATVTAMWLFGSMSLIFLLATFIGLRRQVAARARLEREILVAGERERDRIACDLHDGLGQELTGLSLRLKALSKKLHGEHSAHAETVDNLSAHAQSSVSETRRLSRSLSPGVWTRSGLCDALKSLAQEVDRYPGIDCTAHCSEEDDLDNEEVATQLFRIAQEAINNAMRHGNAKNIELRYSRQGQTGHLVVSDDGDGIPPLLDRVEGLGLRSMRHRARTIGGRLDVRARSRGGTEVRCSFRMPTA